MQNWLEMEVETRQRLLKQKQREPTVTIAIGLISKTTQFKKTRHSNITNCTHNSVIVMASDSQSTYGSAKRVNPNKISEIEFLNGKIMVAQAGSVEFGDKVIEIMEKKAAVTKLEEPETAAKIALESLRELQNHLIDWHKLTVTDWQKFFWENTLDLMIGCFYDKKPYLYKLSIGHGVFTRIKNSFDAIGGGKDLGYMMLNEFSQVDPDFQFADIIAGSVINKVIENIDGCGYPAWIGFVHEDGGEKEHGWTFIYPQFINDCIVEDVKAQERNLLHPKRQQMLKTLEKMWGRFSDDEEVKSFKKRLGLTKRRKK